MFSARQMINHGMFLVNKKRITAKGFLLNPGVVNKYRKGKVKESLNQNLNEKLEINYFKHPIGAH